MPLTPTNTTRTPDSAGEAIKVFDDGAGNLVQGIALLDENGALTGVSGNGLQVESASAALQLSQLGFGAMSEDGLGVDFDKKVDGSSTPVEFWYEVPADKRFDLRAYAIDMRFPIGGGFDWDNFGNGAALANGIIFELRDSGGTPIVGLGGIGSHLGAIQPGNPEPIVMAGSSNVRFIACVSTSEIFGGAAFEVQPEQRLACIVRDDLTGVATTSIEITALGLLKDA